MVILLHVDPFVREAGTGPGVVCLHSNASTSGQWRGLLDDLSPVFHVLAPDLYDCGKSPSWPSDRIISLSDEVALIEPVLARAGKPCMLVGHSYGAAVALIAALRAPSHISALALFEPTLFSLIDAERPAPNEADGIRQAVAQSSAALDADDPDAAARHFIDYWMEEGAWGRTSDSRKPSIVESVKNVRRWAHALMTEPTPLAAFAALDIPVLYMMGMRSPASAHGVARLLTTMLPKIEIVRFAHLGHMGPITHPEVVNPVIMRFAGHCSSGHWRPPGFAERPT